MNTKRFNRRLINIDIRKELLADVRCVTETRSEAEKLAGKYNVSKQVIYGNIRELQKYGLVTIIANPPYSYMY